MINGHLFFEFFNNPRSIKLDKRIRVNLCVQTKQRNAFLLQFRQNMTENISEKWKKWIISHKTKRKGALKQQWLIPRVKEIVFPLEVHTVLLMIRIAGMDYWRNNLTFCWRLLVILFCSFDSENELFQVFDFVLREEALVDFGHEGIIATDSVFLALDFKWEGMHCNHLSLTCI